MHITVTCLPSCCWLHVLFIQISVRKYVFIMGELIWACKMSSSPVWFHFIFKESTTPRLIKSTTSSVIFYLSIMEASPLTADLCLDLLVAWLTLNIPTYNKTGLMSGQIINAGFTLSIPIAPRRWLECPDDDFKSDQPICKLVLLWGIIFGVDGGCN